MRRIINRKVFILLAVATIAGVLVFGNGCNWMKSGWSGKKPPKEDVTEQIDPSKLVGDYARPFNSQPAEIIGFGIVYGLQGTGCPEPLTEERRIITENLRHNPEINVKELLASKNTAVVRVRALVPPGSQKGDYIDLEIVVPPGSETTSLKGGILYPTDLQEVKLAMDGSALKGKAIAKAGGPIILNDNINSKPGSPELIHGGKILGGARLLQPFSMGLELNNKHKTQFYVERLEKSINNRFYVPEQNSNVATSKTFEVLELKVHPRYRYNIPRYRKVVLSIAVFENGKQRSERIERLAEALLVPQTSEDAAFQLEAIGDSEAIGALKKGLQSKNQEVRFYAATSLGYLNNIDAAPYLAEFAKNEPAFRVYALDALTAMEHDYEAETRLAELLDEESAETRYGAFRALLRRNPNDIRIRGEYLNNQFHYHVIASKGKPMVHFTKSKRAEIVLFGYDIELDPGYVLEAGPKIVVKSQRFGEAVVTRLNPDLSETRTVTSRLDDIIRAIVDLGGTYPDVIQFLNEAKTQGILPCKLEIDKLPKDGRVYTRINPDEEDEDDGSVPKKRSFFSRINPVNLFSGNGEKDKNTDPEFDENDYIKLDNGSNAVFEFDD